MSDDQFPHESSVPPPPAPFPDLQEYPGSKVFDFLLGFFGPVIITLLPIVFYLWITGLFKLGAALQPIIIILLNCAGLVLAVLMIRWGIRNNRKFIGYGVITMLLLAFLAPLLAFGMCLLMFGSGHGGL